MKQTKEERVLRVKAYYEANKDKIKAYKLANKDKWKAYQLANKDKTNLRASNKRKTDPLFKLKCNVRGRTYQAFKMKGVKKESKTAIMLGCSFEELREHLVKKFTKGMTLDNMGLWHIDHIIPLASANNEAELIALCNYQNLQPLWAEDNLIKSDSMPLVSKLYS